MTRGTSSAGRRAERLSDAEALMWRIGEHDARLRPIITVVAVLASSPGVDAVAERAAALVVAAPRFARRIAPSVTALSTPRLVVDDQLDLSVHVRRVTAPGEGTIDDVLALASSLAADPLDPSRPLWQMVLVEGMAGGRAALVVRVHHCLTDGMGALALAAVLFADPGEPPPPLRGAPPLRSGAIDALVGDVRHEAAVGLGVVRKSLPVALGLVRAALSADPDGAARAVAGTARSVATAVSPVGSACSPVMVGRSASVVLGALELDLAAARRVGRAQGATVNDVFVAAVVDGMERYHAKHAAVAGVLRVAVPVDLRGSSTGEGDNHFFPARVLVPMGLAGTARLAEVHRLVAAARRQPAVGAFDPLSSLAARLPASPALASRALLAVDVVASNVAGSATPLRLADSRVLQLLPFGPRSGAAVNVTTVSYAGTLHVGVNIDPAAAPDVTTLLGCLSDAFGDAAIAR